MGNIISYLKIYGDRTFTEMPLGAVDAMILAQFSYFNFDGIIPGIEEQEASVSMKQLKEQCHSEHLFSVDWFKDELDELFGLLTKVKRYRSLKINFFVNKIDHEKQAQFSAVTFMLGDGNVFIAFRGTDNELIGWMEDFNMAYLTPVPSQTMAVEYVDQIANIYRRKRKACFYIGGHSKGGNLAVYAAMNCQQKFKCRISAIYNMDGPGFRPEFFEGMDYQSVKEKIQKYVPQSSMVGMILQPDNHYRVVAGTAPGLIQHLPLTWQVDGTDFVYKEEVNPKRKEADEKFNQWILSMNREDTESFLKCMYTLISSTNVTSLKELSDKWIKNIFTVMGKYRKLDRSEKDMFWEMTGIFMRMMVVDGTEILQRMGVLQTFRERIESAGEIKQAK